MAGREADPVLRAAILIQSVDEEREIAVYTHHSESHPEGYRTMTALLVDRGEIVNQWGTRLSA